MVRQLRSARGFTAATHDASHLARSPQNACVSYWEHFCSAYEKLWNSWSKVMRGPSKRSINSSSSTHQLRSQIGTTDTEKLAWMSIGRRWALEGMWITNENDFLVGVSGRFGWFAPRPQPHLQSCAWWAPGRGWVSGLLHLSPGMFTSQARQLTLGWPSTACWLPNPPPLLSLSLYHWWAVKQRVTLQNEPEKPSCPGWIKGCILNRSDHTICSLLQCRVNKSLSF